MLRLWLFNTVRWQRKGYRVKTTGLVCGIQRILKRDLHRDENTLQKIITNNNFRCEFYG